MVRMLTVLLRETEQSLTQRGVMPTLARLVAAPWYFFRNWLYTKRWVSQERKSAFDRRFGVHTEGRTRLSALSIDSPNRVYGLWYEGTPASLFYKAISHLSIDHSEFVFIDLGSGKGKAMLLASELPFKSILGLEFAPELHAIAEQNVREYRDPAQKCTDIKCIRADFTTFPLPHEKLVIYLYNPCRGPAMQKLVDNIERSLVSQPRELYVLYCNPASRNLFDRSEFFQSVLSNKHYCLYQSLPQSFSKCAAFG
jgi:hypothetical protein